LNPMKWYWHRAGGHTHVRVFMNGAKCGDLCFRNEEFDYILGAMQMPGIGVVQFSEEVKP
jgi:hypothetical protein